MKSSKYYLSLLAAVIFPGSVLHATDAFFYFEEEGDGVALDSSGNDLHLHYMDPKSVEISTENSKFGSSSLKFIDSKRGGIQQSLKDESHAKLGGEIRRMSVVAWIYLPEQTEEDTGFVIMLRQSVFSGERLGDWRFSMHDKLGLRFTTRSEGLTVSEKQKNLLHPASWTHYAMTFDEGTVFLYENGVLVAQKSGEKLPIPEVSQNEGRPRIMGLGGLPEGSFVDDLGYFGDTALSESDIDKIMKNGLQDFVKNR